MKRLSILAASLVVAASAQALTTPVSSFSNAQQTTEINQTGTLNLFDSNLGTLTGVSLTYNGAMTSTIGLANRAAGTETVEAVGTTSLRFTSTLAGLNTVISAVPARLGLTVTTGEQDIAAGATRSFGPLNDTKSATLDAALAGFLAQFQAAGGGSFGLGCRSVSGLNLIGGGGNVGSTQATTAGCGASIVYTYTAASTPVPEPTSLALVGLALAAAGFTASRRKA
jgi:PEP-CTERM motif